MHIEFDPAKNEKNIRERDLSFERVREFDFETALFEIDDRFDYGEIRIRAFGFIEQRLYALVFVEIEIENGIRVISFRKANKKEVKKYETKS
jgi:uncharacterized DUF497 family protein